MSQPSQSKHRYRTTNWKHYNAALKARGSLTIWLDKSMSWFAVARGKRGLSPQFSNAAIRFCLTIQNLFGLTLRQTTGCVQSLRTLSGPAWSVPAFSTRCRRLGLGLLGLELIYAAAPSIVTEDIWSKNWYKPLVQTRKTPHKRSLIYKGFLI